MNRSTIITTDVYIETTVSSDMEESVVQVDKSGIYMSIKKR